MPIDDERTEHEPSDAVSLAGRWRRPDADVATGRYPAELDVSAATYRGRRGERQGMIWWDAGTYRLDGPTRLVLSTATDELVSYPVRFGADRVVVETPDEGPIVYERVLVDDLDLDPPFD